MFSGQAEKGDEVCIHDPSNRELSCNIRGTSQTSTVMVLDNKLNHRQQHRLLMNSDNGLNF